MAMNNELEKQQLYLCHSTTPAFTRRVYGKSQNTSI